MKEKDIPSPIPELIWRVPDDNAVLVSPEGGEVTILNEVGTTIWSLINGQNTLETIAWTLVHQYDVDFDHAYQDVINFLTKLDNRSLILWETE
jgi:hypothetical protein